MTEQAEQALLLELLGPRGIVTSDESAASPSPSSASVTPVSLPVINEVVNGSLGESTAASASPPPDDSPSGPKQTVLSWFDIRYYWTLVMSDRHLTPI
jgi:hypothetical protein